ncbi:deoxyribose-phosphate aldolase [Breznakia sp. PF5-3]|uniref:deoxyribose-phosphate aldolase n=1 Tax=unclassified Breznakia TaxID=2623764 RepID=UPI0024052BD8|nr:MULTISPECIES: deoxyribose-phosphate aldolase [unclassified Breznakia]MDL2276243.1 deoxyribose-phosphate aldolase [Breznakia sp. OttesenSCG-928-G09]MDF9824901.1 deoxyribose-phosphate aldolase [Breznakia sp. PM6-1]MDF9835600.1 deoxyribose-phosphate aldolase [Breznakia sp. PF5-3]MDF9837984.1 deoxyribose-phosphate aldolase [Breznakia sp. PFB2-8]MDF9859973.1 deoxyribose-phosphate aldolase [Breznakia sp. PH5-24]
MISKYIDYIDDPNDTFIEYLQKAKKLNVRCVFASLDQYDEAVAYLKDTDIIVAGAIDFPEGNLCLEDKLKAFQMYADKGFKEIDYVLNQKNVEERNYEGLLEELKAVATFCKEHQITDKAIVEMCKLDEEAKVKICELANQANPSFLKTSTGKSFGGAKLHDVELMKKYLNDNIKIKAAGGIRSYLFAKELVDAGAQALGASAAIQIINEEN